MRRWLRAAPLLVAAAACSPDATGPHHEKDAGAPDAKLPPPTSPAFDKAWRISTHNSYWVDRGTEGDLFASGTQERLLDQLLHDHARGVEIDIHRDPATKGAFTVFHTLPGNGLCDTLAGCLGILRAFHRTLPRHEALHVTLELKELSAANFDADHTVDDLDRVLTDELGALLYRPRDLLDRCPGEEHLGACVRAAGWPTTSELRGRVLVSVLGNWNGLPGAQATRDWIDYTLHGTIRGRAAFPMASSWQLDREALSGLIYGLVEQRELDDAYAESVFLQIEDLADPNTKQFLGRGGVVRVDNAFSVADQETRIAAGLQLLQTDSPWVQAGDEGPSLPVRSLDPRFGDETVREEGARLALGPGLAGERLFAYLEAEPESSRTWETTVSSGSDATRVGCLRAATALGPTPDAITVCRSKVAAGMMAASDAEQVVLTIETCSAGTCTTAEVRSNDPAPDQPGDLLRLEVESHASGSSCVKVSSASTASAELEVVWVPISAPVCVSAPLTYQGLAAPSPAAGAASAFFFGSRLDGVDLEVTSLTGVEASSATSRDEPSLIQAF